ncbi:MAG TPA: cytosine deaminase [Xanthobacteraceae bacterium]|nr:cytosine deaminase [Xanthobacteraceae bacterium]
MTRAFADVPAADFRLINARVPACLLAADGLGPADADGLASCDIRVERGRVALVAPAGSNAPAEGPPSLDVDYGIVLPRLVDVHTHLDKGHIHARRPNPDGTIAGARHAVMADRAANWSAADVRARMEFALRCAYAHGTGAIRTHIDSMGRQTAITWPVLGEVRADWKDRIAVQAVSLYPLTMALDDEAQFRRVVETTARHGGILGGNTFPGEPIRDLDLALDRAFAAAKAHGLDLDFHVDESASEHARSLGAIARAAVRHKFPGRVVAGHCCSLTLYRDNERADTIARVADAGIAVVSLPMCNMYLQDRAPGRTPRWRGITPLHELAAAGVATMVASDNTRDPFYAYGDLDLVEVFREATRIGHLDHCAHPWIAAVAATPADVMGLRGHGRIAAGRPADLIVTRARTLNELLSRPQADRLVLVAGRQIDTTLPDYRELDGLVGRG